MIKEIRERERERTPLVSYYSVASSRHGQSVFEGESCLSRGMNDEDDDDDRFRL